MTWATIIAVLRLGGSLVYRYTDGDGRQGPSYSVTLDPGGYWVVFNPIKGLPWEQEQYRLHEMEKWTTKHQNFSLP